jgi:hypothetical protein
LLKSVKGRGQITKPLFLYQYKPFNTAEIFAGKLLEMRKLGLPRAIGDLVDLKTYKVLAPFTFGFIPKAA